MTCFVSFMKLVFLGTSGMVPTKDRNVQSIYLDYNGEGILLDCGEGTQRQISIAGLNAQKIKTILISHWHGDHVSGLVGLLQTLGNFSSEGKKIRLFGPKGTKEYFKHTMSSCIFENTLDIEITELEPKGLETFYENNEYELQAISLEHSTPCIGYSFVKKERRKMNSKKLGEFGIKQGPMVGQLQSGKSVQVDGRDVKPEDVSEIEGEHKIAFIFDTQLTNACYDLANGADLVVSEAVYKHELAHKAEEYKHMTAHQAAQVASEAGASELILTHFSQRYKDVSELELEAKDVFENVRCAYDFMKVDLGF